MFFHVILRPLLVVRICPSLAKFFYIPDAKEGNHNIFSCNLFWVLWHIQMTVWEDIRGLACFSQSSTTQTADMGCTKIQFSFESFPSRKINVPNDGHLALRIIPTAGCPNSNIPLQGRTGTENRPGQFPTTTLPVQPNFHSTLAKSKPEGKMLIRKLESHQSRPHNSLSYNLL